MKIFLYSFFYLSSACVMLIVCFWLSSDCLGCVKIPIATMQQFALNTWLHESLHAADVSLQNLAASVMWVWFGFERRRQRNLFGCFAAVEYILLKNNDILQSV